MNLNYKSELKKWSVYFATIFLAFFIHELGHCVVAWLHGKRAVPTPAKEYLLDPVSADLNRYISLGGVLGTVFFSLLIIFLFVKNSNKFNSSILAGALATPGIYSFLFLLKGRGHDETEFQEAQSALGLSYSGHALDWFFLALFFAGILLWVIRSKPSYKIIPRLVFGFVLSFLFMAGLQKINNNFFDPIFLK